MKKFLISFLFIFIFYYTISAQSWRLAIGPNFSTFLNEPNSKIYVGYTLGLQYEHFITKCVSISSGLMFSKEGALLENIIIKPTPLIPGFTQLDIFYVDLKAIIGYLKIPILFGYSTEIFEDYCTKFLIGSSFLIPIVDYSNETNIRYAFTYYENITDYNFKYSSTGEESFFFENDFNYSFDVGISQTFKKITLEILYNYQINNFGYIDYTKIKQNLTSLKIMFCYNF